MPPIPNARTMFMSPMTQARAGLPALLFIQLRPIAYNMDRSGSGRLPDGDREDEQRRNGVEASMHQYSRQDRSTSLIGPCQRQPDQEGAGQKHEAAVECRE